MKTFTSSLENAQPHIVYDLSIPLPERIEKAVVYRTAKDVALVLGLNYSAVTHYRQRGRRVVGKDGKEYAIRIASQKILQDKKIV